MNSRIAKTFSGIAAILAAIGAWADVTVDTYRNAFSTAETFTLKSSVEPLSRGAFAACRRSLVRLHARSRFPMLKCAAKLLLEREEGLQGGVGKQDSAKGAANYEQPARLFIQLLGS